MTSQDHKNTQEQLLVEEYLSLTKTSRSLFERACKVSPGGNTRRALFYNPYPAYIVRGQGCKIYDVDGREYIDYTNNLGPLILGHNPPQVVSAIRKQLEKGTVLGGPTELEIRLAEEILKAFPSGEQILFCASGTEADMLGLRAVRAYTGRDMILRCDGSFHGTSDFFLEGLGIPKDVPEKTIKVPYNDIERFESAVKRYREKLAAVFMEPMMRGIPPKPDYLKEVREITRKNGVLLVLDEVVTGFRLSRGGAQEKWGIQGDMTLLGKIIGGGLPIGAVVSSRELLKHFRSEDHSSLVVDRAPLAQAGTWNAHPVAMAGGLAVLGELTPWTYAHLDQMGEALRKGMEKAAEKAGIIAQISGTGSIFHIYFTDQPIIDSVSANTTNQLLLRYYDLSMIIKGINPAKAHCSYISTPITDKEVQDTLAAVEETLYSMRPLVQKVAPFLTK
jgi:glutamate-1-semialdehyde 2,1-aminomutase